MEADRVPAFDVIVDRDVMVPMRDGVKLATDIYRPAQNGASVDGPCPTLLQRTPYNKAEVEEHTGWARSFVQRGYAVVLQDCRGCFNSQGDFDFLIPDANDGQDTVAWLREQPWCGRVGSFGISYAGWTQTAMAAVGTAGLDAMIPTQSGANGYTSSIRHGGAMELRVIAWAFLHSARNVQRDLKRDPWLNAALNVGATPFGEWLQRWPIRPGVTQLALVRAYERWVFELLTHADYDEYWEHPSLNPSAHWDTFTDAPTLVIGGWYDSYTRAAFELYEGLSANKRGPIKVIVGPWTHGALHQPFAGDVWFGHDAAIDFVDLHLRWFDRWLSEIHNGAQDDAPVRIFVMGGGPGTRGPDGRLHHGGHWRDESEWPLARTRFTPYYLSEDGGLGRQRSSIADASTTFQFNPSRPVPTIGGNTSSFVELASLPSGIADPRHTTLLDGVRPLGFPGGFDQREGSAFFGSTPPYLPLAARADVLVFQSEPLEEDVEITGPVEVRLWVTSSVVDTDFTAKLIDVYPPNESYPFGYALNLTDAITRLRYRNDPATPSLLTPGEVEEVTVTLYPISNVFAAGHRIRLDVSSSNFPRFDVNPNTGGPLGRERRQVVADNTVFHDAARPSHVVLPIVPSRQ